MRTRGGKVKDERSVQTEDTHRFGYGSVETRNDLLTLIFSNGYEACLFFPRAAFLSDSLHECEIALTLELMFHFGKQSSSRESIYIYMHRISKGRQVHLPL